MIRWFYKYGFMLMLLNTILYSINETKTLHKEIKSAVKLDLEKIAHACINDEFELESVSVFDLYEGRELPKDKKSLAFSLVFRSLERTLTDLEVNRIFGEIQKNISEHTDYKVRS